jgi:hypothetical protein
MTIRGDSLTESSESVTTTRYSGGIHPDDSGGAGSSQNAPPAPNRTPTTPNKNNLGTYGICYDRWLNTNPLTREPTTGWPYLSGEPYYVAVDGQAENTGYCYFPTTKANQRIADDFAGIMGNNGFSQRFELGDAQVTQNLLQRTSEGGLSIFNAVNFGFLITHGDAGSTAEDDGVKYSYLWIENPTGSSASYLRLSDFDFGGSGSAGLRWMAIQACSPLNQTDWNSMNNHSKYPVNSNFGIDRSLYDPKPRSMSVSTTSWKDQTNIITERGVAYSRRIDGIDEQGSCFYIEFGGNNKVLNFELNWRNLVPYKPYSIADTNDIIQFIKSSKATWSDSSDEDSLSRIQKLTITRFDPIYFSRPGRDKIGFEFPFAEVTLEGQVGTNTMQFYLNCPLIK